MPFKSSLARSAGKLLGVFKERDLSLRGATQSNRVPPLFTASGGDVDGLAPGNGYKYHAFTSPGNFVVQSGSATIELLMVGGGGGGGIYYFGGGAGGVIFYGSTSTPVTWGASLPISAGSFSLSVGAGGNPIDSDPAPAPDCTAAKGGDTTFTHPSGPFTAQGGGIGGNAGPGSYDGSPLARGGSGGWGEGAYPGSPNPSPNRQGYPGAPPSANNGMGGGGGAGAVGSPSPTGSSGWNATGGNGGVGVQFPDFTGTLIGVPGLSPLNGYYAGGGGAGGRNDNNGGPAPQTGFGGAGGNGGGGHGVGSRGQTYPGGPTYAAAVTNSGGGGGGSGAGGPLPGSNGPQIADPGGSGIVVIRYQVV